jgi:hypothetical protein
MKKIFVVLAVLLFICAWLPAKAQTQTLPTVSFTMGSVYAPARFVLEFAYCQNFSGPLNMQTLSGSSLWTSQESPVGFEFDAKDVDTYTFDVELIYNATVNQVLTLSYWAGDLAPDSIKLQVLGNDILIHFQMVVTTEPVVPSKEEVAQAVVLQMKQDLADYEGEIANLAAQFQESLMVMWAVVAIALFAAILSLVVAFYAIRSAHQERRR